MGNIRHACLLMKMALVKTNEASVEENEVN
jgi:hypothetical protein